MLFRSVVSKQSIAAGFQFCQRLRHVSFCFKYFKSLRPVPPSPFLFVCAWCTVFTMIAGMPFAALLELSARVLVLHLVFEVQLMLCLPSLELRSRLAKQKLITVFSFIFPFLFVCLSFSRVLVLSFCRTTNYK